MLPFLFYFFFSPTVIVANPRFSGSLTQPLLGGSITQPILEGSVTQPLLEGSVNVSYNQ